MKDKIRNLIKSKKENTNNLERIKSHHHVHHYKTNALLIGIIILALLLLIIMKPAFIGFTVSSQFDDVGVDASTFIKDQEMLESELTIKQTELNSCRTLNKDYLERINLERNAGNVCLQEKQGIQSDYNNLKSEYDFETRKVELEFQQRKEEVELGLFQLQSNYDELKSIYSDVLSSSARNICCKAKVDNDAINSYVVSNGRIICGMDKEYKISC